MAELVSLIKKSRTPLICIANDASTPKMKTLKNYCDCITWKRVPAAQIAPRIQEICRKEGLQIDRPSLEKLAESTQGDIRQILNFLQFARQVRNMQLTHTPHIVHMRHTAYMLVFLHAGYLPPSIFHSFVSSLLLSFFFLCSGLQVSLFRRGEVSHRPVW